MRSQESAGVRKKSTNLFRKRTLAEIPVSLVGHTHFFEFKAESEATKEFESGNDWMRDLTVAFENTSNKNIVYVRFFLLFPETTVAGPIMGSPLSR